MKTLLRYDVRVWLFALFSTGAAWFWVLQWRFGRERTEALRERIRRNSIARGLFFSLYASTLVHDLRWSWMLGLVVSITAATWLVDSRLGQAKPQAKCALIALGALSSAFCVAMSNAVPLTHAIAWAALAGAIAGIVTMFNVPPLSRAVPIAPSSRSPQ